MHITRRVVLGAAAAMAATPALAQQCQVGLPAHHNKGPLVYKSYDQAELDAAYKQEIYEPLMARVNERLAAGSYAVRDRLGKPQRIAYGPTPFEKLYVYRTDLKNGVQLFQRVPVPQLFVDARARSVGRN